MSRTADDDTAVQPDAGACLRALLRGVDDDLALLRELRASGTSGDRAASALRDRDESAARCRAGAAEDREDVG